MSIKQFIKRILTGLTVPQEYVCIDSALFPSASSVLLQSEDSTHPFDVTHTHLFLGYKPVIFGLVFRKNSLEFEQWKNESVAQLSFQSIDNGWSLASIQIKKINKKELRDEVVLFYEGIQGRHVFLSRFHQWVNGLRERTRSRKHDNIQLLGNLYDQVRIAYSVPRKISVITVSDGMRINVFPTDLHGPVGKEFYMGSLRKNGLVNAQVDRYKKIVISDVASESYREVYALGKNHMKDLREPGEFDLCLEKSAAFGFPLPSRVTKYRELEQIDSFDCGIHRLHVYKVVNDQSVSAKDSSLAHIHQYYAQWRVDHHQPTNMLLR